MKKWVYSFNEGNAEYKNLLGGKGANLSEMTNIGLPVPYGFTISTEACNDFYNNKKKISKEIEKQIMENIEKIEIISGKKFGDIENPLLVSVRSGAAISMPGMMDTILNLGLNDASVEGLSSKTNNPRFCYDSYRRFIQMYGDVALNIPKYKFDRVLESIKEKNNCKMDTDLTVENLKEIIEKYKTLYLRETGDEFPQNPIDQLMIAVEAVFKSWNNTRAISYRNLYEISHDIGTAVNIQSMVFGNMGNDSGTGVAFTRNPATGENRVFGEFLMNAQGEDVVAGIRTPLEIDELKNIMPDIYEEFIDTAKNLENHYKDMQDIEFTIEQGKLYFLQTRTGKRTAEAAIRVATEMVEEKLITKEEAISRVDVKSLDQLLHPTFDPETMKNAIPLAKGLPASPGAATGKIYFNAEDAVAAAASGEKVILVRKETSPEDIDGMTKSEGILTARGGMTSHAAVVARGMGKCCVSGCAEIYVDEELKIFRVGEIELHEGEYISLDGSTGNIYHGSINTVEAEITGTFNKLMMWADEVKKLGVRANADNPRDAKVALDFGAEGIGLCRTEHMFFEESRIFSVRKMIIAENILQREAALAEILPVQKEDFKGIYRVMESKPVTIRLLDPPLHEFLPTNDEDIKELAVDMNIAFRILKEKVNSLHEFNPMLGHRGCRLSVTYPEIAKMQVRAIIEAAIEISQELNIEIKPEIMIPLVGKKEELVYVKRTAIEEIEAVFEEKNTKLPYLIGTMIEIPRAALTSDEIAEEAEFFSFGTNDLTQMTFGYSRDDAGKFIGEYKDVGILKRDPFRTIDVDGVGKLVEMSIKLGRKTKPELKIGVCGEHGGDPDSIHFFNKIDLDYVSCSPFRVPQARLSAAQAQIKG